MVTERSNSKVLEFNISSQPLSEFCSSSSRSSLSIFSANKSFKQINENINNGQYYEAFQIIQTLYHRYMFKKRYDEASHLCYEFAHKLAEKAEYNLSVEVAMFFVKNLAEMKITPTEQNVQQIIDIFGKYPKFEAKHKYRLMNKALEWVKSESNNEQFLRRLHLSIGNSYIEENAFGCANGHLVYCHDGKRLAEMIKKWKLFGYPSERNLFSLRNTLILIFLGDLETAEEFVNNLEVDFDSENVHPALQFAYLLVMACKHKNKKFYEILRKKYNLMIRRDPSFETYLAEIEKKYFDKSKGNNFNLSQLFNSLAAGMASGTVGNRDEIA